MCSRGLVFLVLLVSLSGCPARQAAIGPPPEVTMDSRQASDEVRALIDRALRENGDFGVYGDLSSGLASLEADFAVSLTRSPESWYVSAGPHSGAGHDFGFEVVDPTGEIRGLVVGEIAPEPTWDEGAPPIPPPVPPE